MEPTPRQTKLKFRDRSLPAQLNDDDCCVSVCSIRAVLFQQLLFIIGTRFRPFNQSAQLGSVVLLIELLLLPLLADD